MTSGTEIEELKKKLSKKFDIDSGRTYDDSMTLISTGSLALDIALGGGVATGRLCELFGSFSTGKSVLGWTILRETQRLGGLPVLFEAEHAFKKDFAEKCGLDLANMLVVIPESVEHFFEQTEEIANSYEKYPFCAVVLDSLAGLPSSKEFESSAAAYKSVDMGKKAQEISQGLRRLIPIIRKRSIALVIVNQIREKVGVLFGDTRTTPGGNAVKFHASQRILLSSKQDKIMNDKKIAIGIEGVCTIAKNKIAPPFRQSEFRIWYGGGVDRHFGLPSVLVQEGRISHSGGWYSLGERKFRADGIEAVVTEHPELLDGILCKNEISQDTIAEEGVVQTVESE